MKVFAKPGVAKSSNEDQQRARLIAVFDACTACELASTLAADTLERRRTPHAGLIACAAVFGETAFHLSQLRVPNCAHVRDELIACRAACALAREACESCVDDAVARRCILECERCARACDQVVSSFVSMAA